MEVEELDNILRTALEMVETRDEEVVKSLKTLSIEPPAPVPLSHTIETSITHGLSYEIKRKFEECGLEMKYGHFTKEEDDVIKLNWESFKHTYGFHDPRPFLPIYENRKTLSRYARKKFVQYIGMGLPNRSLNGIYSRFKRLYQTVDKSSQFSDWENRLILRCLEIKMIKPFKVLSQALGRDRECIYKHYKFVLSQNGQYPKRVKWTQDLILQLINALIEVTKTKNICDLKGVTIPCVVWFKVSEQIGISPHACQSVWRMKLYTQLFSKGPVYKNETSVILLHRLYKSKLKYFEDVNWPTIASQYFSDKGINSYFLWRLMRRMIGHNVPEKRKKTLRSCVKFLIKHWVPRVVKREIKEKKLTRYMYVDKNTLLQLED